MAAQVDTSLNAKYCGYYLESPDVDENALREQRRLTERDRENKAMFETGSRFGVSLGQPIPLELLPRRMRLTKGNKISDYNGLSQTGGGQSLTAAPMVIESFSVPDTYWGYCVGGNVGLGFSSLQYTSEMH